MNIRGNGSRINTMAFVSSIKKVIARLAFRKTESGLEDTGSWKVMDTTSIGWEKDSLKKAEDISG